MTAPLKLSSDEVTQMRTHYQGVTHDLMNVLWRQRFLIATFVIAGFVCGICAIIALPPRYTSEAILQVNFNREEPNPTPTPNTTTRTQRIASLEAAGVVESTVRVLRSRTIIDAAVSRLRLENDPAFARQSTLQRLIWPVRQALGLPVMVPSAHEIAAQRLSDKLQINIVPRSYVISISISAADPQRAAQIANAVVLEYLRSQRIQQMAEMQRTVEKEIAEMSAIYAPRHPRILDARQRLQEVKGRVADLSRMELPPEAMSTDYGEFLPAEPVVIPSGPNAPIVMALMLLLSLFACAGMIAFIELKGFQHIASNLRDSRAPITQVRPW
jgi:uncharacterized protein involved in exopolysaccharide biosynthesis